MESFTRHQISKVRGLLSVLNGKGVRRRNLAIVVFRDGEVGGKRSLTILFKGVGDGSIPFGSPVCKHYARSNFLDT